LGLESGCLSRDLMNVHVFLRLSRSTFWVDSVGSCVESPSVSIPVQIWDGGMMMIQAIKVVNKDNLFK